MPIQDQRNGLLLDESAGFIAEFFDGFEQVLV
jgi:hypothetical protein